jgi:hypothetical protein
MPTENTAIVSHTEGPWGWVSVPGAKTIGIHGPTGPIEGVATVHARDEQPRPRRNVTLANARLIASAPELLAAAANLPVLLALLAEARAALPAEFCGTTDSLAGRIDAVIHQAAPKPVCTRGDCESDVAKTGSCHCSIYGGQDVDLVWERLPSGEMAWLKADLTDPDRSPQRLFGGRA